MPADKQKAVAGCFRVLKEQEKAAAELAWRAKGAEKVLGRILPTIQRELGGPPSTSQNTLE